MQQGTGAAPTTTARTYTAGGASGSAPASPAATRLATDGPSGGAGTGGSVLVAAPASHRDGPISPLHAHYHAFRARESQAQSEREAQAAEAERSAAEARRATAPVHIQADQPEASLLQPIQPFYSPRARMDATAAPAQSPRASSVSRIAKPATSSSSSSASDRMSTPARSPSRPASASTKKPTASPSAAAAAKSAAAAPRSSSTKSTSSARPSSATGTAKAAPSSSATSSPTPSPRPHGASISSSSLTRPTSASDSRRSAVSREKEALAAQLLAEKLAERDADVNAPSRPKFPFLQRKSRSRSTSVGREIGTGGSAERSTGRGEQNGVAHPESAFSKIKQEQRRRSGGGTFQTSFEVLEPPKGKGGKQRAEDDEATLGVATTRLSAEEQTALLTPRPSQVLAALDAGTVAASVSNHSAASTLLPSALALENLPACASKRVPLALAGATGSTGLSSSAPGCSSCHSMHLRVDRQNVELLQLREQLKTLEGVRGQESHLSKAKARLQAELDACTSKLSRSESRCATLSNQLTTLRLEQERHLAHVLSSQSRVQEEASKERFDKEVASLKHELSQAQAAREEVTLEKKGLVTKLAALATAKRALERSLASLESSYRTLQEHHEALLARSRRAEEHLERGSTALDSAEEEKLRLELAQDKLLAEIAQERREKLQEAEEADSLRAEMDSLRDALAHAQGERDSMAQYRELYTAAQAQLESEVRRAAEAREQLRREREQVRTLRGELTATQAEVESWATEYEQLVASARRNESLGQSARGGGLGRSEQEASYLHEIAAVRSQIAQMRAEKVRSIEENRELKQQLHARRVSGGVEDRDADSQQWTPRTGGHEREHTEAQREQRQHDHRLHQQHESHYFDGEEGRTVHAGAGVPSHAASRDRDSSPSSPRPRDGSPTPMPMSRPPPQAAAAAAAGTIAVPSPTRKVMSPSARNLRVSAVGARAKAPSSLAATKIPRAAAVGSASTSASSPRAAATSRAQSASPSPAHRRPSSLAAHRQDASNPTTPRMRASPSAKLSAPTPSSLGPAEAAPSGSLDDSFTEHNASSFLQRAPSPPQSPDEVRYPHGGANGDHTGTGGGGVAGMHPSEFASDADATSLSPSQLARSLQFFRETYTDDASQQALLVLEGLMQQAAILRAKRDTKQAALHAAVAAAAAAGYAGSSSDGTERLRAELRVLSNTLEMTKDNVREHWHNLLASVGSRDNVSAAANAPQQHDQQHHSHRPSSPPQWQPRSPSTYAAPPQQPHAVSSWQHDRASSPPHSGFGAASASSSTASVYRPFVVQQSTPSTFGAFRSAPSASGGEAAAHMHVPASFSAAPSSATATAVARDTHSHSRFTAWAAPPAAVTSNGMSTGLSPTLLPLPQRPSFSSSLAAAQQASALRFSSPAAATSSFSFSPARTLAGGPSGSAAASSSTQSVAPTLQRSAGSPFAPTASSAGGASAGGSSFSLQVSKDAKHIYITHQSVPAAAVQAATGGGGASAQHAGASASPMLLRSPSPTPSASPSPSPSASPTAASAYFKQLAMAVPAAAGSTPSAGASWTFQRPPHSFAYPDSSTVGAGAAAPSDAPAMNSRSSFASPFSSRNGAPTAHRSLLSQPFHGVGSGAPGATQPLSFTSPAAGGARPSFTAQAGIGAR